MFNYCIIYIQRNLPWYFRTRRHIVWLWVLLRPISDIVTAFFAFKVTTIYNINLNSQTIVLTQALNDRYPTALGGIYIINGDVEDFDSYIFSDTDSDASYIWTDVEGNAFYLFSDYETAEFDFIVMVPAATVFTVAEMTAFINLYKIAGKRFKIQTY